MALFNTQSAIVNLRIGSATPSLILMAKSEELFRFTPDVDEPVIDAIYKIRARGVRQYVLNSQNIKKGKESAVREMVNITCAFATILFAHLCEKNYPGGIVSTKADNRVRIDQWRSLSEQQLIQTMRLTFDDQSIDSTIFEVSKSTCSGKSLDEHLEIPQQILIAYQKLHKNGLDTDLKKLLWRTAVDRMRKLSVIILALSSKKMRKARRLSTLQRTKLYEHNGNASPCFFHQDMGQEVGNRYSCKCMVQFGYLTYRWAISEPGSTTQCPCSAATDGVCSSTPEDLQI
ncbi:hypothetical protein N7G274_006119 [Stereocaulon virgatum]|uniref:Uncharacterized protein n=1 Tax=Stereocaulon virgatum TaxID=373712 RepID=A0ABR4A7V8_9LECA